MKNKRVLQITIVANLTALAYLLYYIKFPLPFIFPSFLDIQLSNLPAIIGGFALGPIAGGAIVVIRTSLKLLSTSTAGVGELVDLIIGLSTVLTSSVIYMKMKTKKGAIIAMVFGMLAWILASVLTNWLFAFDAYVELYFGGILEDALILLKVIPGVTTENYMSKYIFLAIIPFNILLSGLVYTITYLVYKRIFI